MESTTMSIKILIQQWTRGGMCWFPPRQSVGFGPHWHDLLGPLSQDVMQHQCVIPKCGYHGRSHFDNGKWLGSCIDLDTKQTTYVHIGECLLHNHDTSPRKHIQDDKCCHSHWWRWHNCKHHCPNKGHQTHDALDVDGTYHPT